MFLKDGIVWIALPICTLYFSNHWRRVCYDTICSRARMIPWATYARNMCEMWSEHARICSEYAWPPPIPPAYAFYYVPGRSVDCKIWSNCQIWYMVMLVTICRFSFEYPSLLDWYMVMLATFCRFSFEYPSLPDFNNLAHTDISLVCVASPHTPCSRNSVNSNLHP